MSHQRWHHRDLDVWQRSMDAVLRIYALTNELPATEKFALTSQMRRAATSIPANIAEGAARGTSREFVRFLLIARGSLAELETHLELVSRLRLANVEESLRERIDAIRQMLSGLIRKIANQA